MISPPDLVTPGFQPPKKNDDSDSIQISQCSCGATAQSFFEWLEREPVDVQECMTLTDREKAFKPGQCGCPNCFQQTQKSDRTYYLAAVLVRKSLLSNTF